LASFTFSVIINTSNEEGVINMTTYEEIISRVSLLNDDELREVFERCSDIYNDHQRIKRGILKKQLTDKLHALLDEILNNNFSLCIENLNTNIHEPYHRVCLGPDKNYEIEIS
jgi:hypothetical protein